jgi:hypothetical protein
MILQPLETILNYRIWSSFFESQDPNKKVGRNLEFSQELKKPLDSHKLGLPLLSLFLFIFVRWGILQCFRVLQFTGWFQTPELKGWSSFSLLVFGNCCSQKILVLVLQMEESKQNTWTGWGRRALLREEESTVLSHEGREGEGAGSLGRSFLYYLELGDGAIIHNHLASLTCGLGEGVLEPRGGAVPDNS